MPPTSKLITPRFNFNRQHVVYSTLKELRVSVLATVTVQLRGALYIASCDNGFMEQNQTAE
jgi:hypothetical protein